MKYGEQESKSYWETCLSPRPHWDPFRDWGYGMQQSGLPTASGTQDWINQQPFRQQANTPYEFNKFQSQVTTENGQWKLALNVRFFEPEGICLHHKMSVVSQFRPTNKKSPILPKK